MMPLMNWTDAPCPVCKAAVGEPCVVKRPRDRVAHLARQDRVVRMYQKW